MALFETVADRLTGGKLTQATETAQQLQETATQQAAMITTLTESLARLEQVLYSSEWRRLTVDADHEFTREGLRLITQLARIMRLKNPLIKRGVEVQRLYVWAQGVNIRAKDDAINAVIQAFLDDERNRAELTTHQARGEKEADLQTDGNLFFRFFVNPQNGRVRIRTIDPQEIEDIITNPDDRREPWFYRRMWTQVELDGRTTTRTEYYPDWRYHPRNRAAAQLPGIGRQVAGGATINWDTPVYHVRTNPLGRWGVSEFYAALDWALAYKSFLEQLASVWQALARWAWKLTHAGGSRGVAAAKTKLNTTLVAGGEEGNPPPLTGSVFVQAQDKVDMQPFRTAGATMSAEDGRRLLLMAAAVFGFPETFYGDVSVGTLATATSLDRPTELKIRDRQMLWEDIHQDILGFVLLWAVKAPAGPLRTMGRLVREPDDDEWIEYVDWGETDATISIDFPAVVESDVAQMVNAIIDAANMKGGGNGIPTETAVSRLLTELGFQDVDAIMDIWREQEEERKSRAEEMAARLPATPPPANGNGVGAQTPSNEEEEPAAEAWRRQVEAVTALLADLREAISANGHG